MYRFTSENLAKVFSNVPAFEPKAGALLKQRPLPFGPFSFVSADEDALVEATVELIDMAREADSTVRKLRNLPPVPLVLPDEGVSL